MTPNEFRQLALNLPGVTERQHMNHPNFRVEGRIFATLGYPEKNWGMVRLTPVGYEDSDSCLQMTGVSRHSTDEGQLQ